MRIPLVFLSGLLSNELVWEYQISHLRDLADITVISPSQDTPEKMLQEILEKAPSTFALAGHSMGGWLCLEVMRHAPTRVSKLCLLNTTARSDTQEKIDARKMMIRRCEQGEFEQVAKELAAYFTLSKSVKGKVEKMFLGVGKDIFINQEHSMLLREDCLSILKQISCPTLIIYADHDRVFSLEEHLELEARIPSARLTTVEGAGHMSPMEKPEEVNDLLQKWLTS